MRVFPGRLLARLYEADKQLHIRWSFWLTLAAHLLWPLGWSVAAAFVLGLAKEFWDQRYGSGFCWIDIIGNLVGISGAIVVSLLLAGTGFN